MVSKKKEVKKEFKWKEWNHEYLGWLLLITGVCLYLFTSWTITGSGITAIGFMTSMDGLYQLKYGQDKGPMHVTYIALTSDWEWARKAEAFVDKLFGKDLG